MVWNLVFKIKFRPIVVVAVVVFKGKDATCDEFIVVVVDIDIVVGTGKEEGPQRYINEIERAIDV